MATLNFERPLHSCPRVRKLDSCADSVHVLRILKEEITHVRCTPVYLVTRFMSCKEETGTGGDASPHTEQEERHAALQLQEITSVSMTKVSGESSDRSIHLRHSVHSVCSAKARNMLQHKHTDVHYSQTLFF